MPPKINDGLSNIERYKLRHPDRVKASYRKRRKSGKIAAYYRKRRKKQRMELLKPQLKTQKNRCAICKRLLKRPNQDHDHRCCKPKGGGTSGCSKCRRGLLCGSCNGSLAIVENPKLLRAALAYLKKWRLSGK